MVSFTDDLPQCHITSLELETELKSHCIVTCLCIIRKMVFQQGGADMKQETTHSSPQVFQRL